MVGLGRGALLSAVSGQAPAPQDALTAGGSEHRGVEQALPGLQPVDVPGPPKQLVARPDDRGALVEKVPLREAVPLSARECHGAILAQVRGVRLRVAVDAAVVFVDASRAADAEVSAGDEPPAPVRSSC